MFDGIINGAFTGRFGGFFCFFRRDLYFCYGFVHRYKTIHFQSGPAVSVIHPFCFLINISKELRQTPLLLLKRSENKVAVQCMLSYYLYMEEFSTCCDLYEVLRRPNLKINTPCDISSSSPNLGTCTEYWPIIQLFAYDYPYHTKYSGFLGIGLLTEFQDWIKITKASSMVPAKKWSRWRRNEN